MEINHRNPMKDQIRSMCWCYEITRCLCKQHQQQHQPQWTSLADKKQRRNIKVMLKIRSVKNRIKNHFQHIFIDFTKTNQIPNKIAGYEKVHFSWCWPHTHKRRHSTPLHATPFGPNIFFSCSLPLAAKHIL